MINARKEAGGLAKITPCSQQIAMYEQSQIFAVNLHWMTASKTSGWTLIKRAIYSVLQGLVVIAEDNNPRDAEGVVRSASQPRLLSYSVKRENT